VDSVENRKHSIYMFFDENGVPFYVGKTKEFIVRKKKHLSEVKYGNRLYCYNKLRKVLKTVPVFLAIREVFTGIEEKNIDAVEMAWIKFLRQRGVKLTNLTDGGEGGKGFTPEINRRAALKRRGWFPSLETRRRISEAHMGMVFTEEHKKNLSAAWKPRPREMYEKISRNTKGRINAKVYECISPKGKSYYTSHGLTLFCEQHGLQAANMHKVLKGQRSDSKGWTIRRVVTSVPHKHD